MKRKLVLAFLAGLAIGVGATLALWQQLHGGPPGQANVVRNEPLEQAGRRQWARPLDCPGVGNFHRVSPSLYRGAQPTSEGIRNLKEMGVKSILNLRYVHSDRDEIGRTDIACEHLHFNPLHPEDEDVVKFLRIATDPARLPVFVHCQHGSDRTGMMCAVYRVAVEGWTKDQAAAEWTEGGFGFHDEFQNLIRYFRDLDVDAVKREAGVATRPATPRP